MGLWMRSSCHQGVGQYECSNRAFCRTIPCLGTIDMTNPIQILKTRLGLSDVALAAYLGVPRTTAINWSNGKRKPPAVAHRLIEVLRVIEVMAPDVHGHLLPQSKGK